MAENIRCFCAKYPTNIPIFATNIRKISDVPGTVPVPGTCTCCRIHDFAAKSRNIRISGRRIHSFAAKSRNIRYPNRIFGVVEVLQKHKTSQNILQDMGEGPTLIPVVKILFACPPPYKFKKSPYKQVLYGDSHSEQ